MKLSITNFTSNVVTSVDPEGYPSISFKDEDKFGLSELRQFLDWDQMRILRDQLTAALDAKEKKNEQP